MSESPRFPVVAPSVSVQYNELSFSQALRYLVENQGGKVTKLEWNDQSIWLEMRNARLHIHNDSGYHTLIVSEGDILGLDYIIL